MATINTIGSERMLLGLSQEDLAAKIGKGRGTIARWEADPSCISGRYLVRLSKIFGCTTDYLLGLTPERTTRTVA